MCPNRVILLCTFSVFVWEKDTNVWRVFRENLLLLPILYSSLVFAGFIFRRFAIFAFFVFLNSRLVDTVVLKYSRVKCSRIYEMSPHTVIVYGSCRGFVWRCHRIKWRAASEDFTSKRRYECLSLEKGLVAPTKETTEKIRSLLQWREALKRSAMCRARSRASVSSSCGSVGPYPVKLQEAADRARQLIAIFITHDVIDWLELYMSIYSDVQIFADTIFADGCWSAKTANIKPREN